MTFLKDKVAWVTGSSRGIGRVVADHLASLGARVVVHGTSPTSSRAFDEADSLEAVAREIAEEHHAQVLAVHGNLAEPSTVERIKDEIRKGLGPVDVLIACAGGGRDGVRAMMEALYEELGRTMSITGSRTVNAIDPSILHRLDLGAGDSG